MILLEDELKYLSNIRITSEFDAILCGKIKKFLYKILEMNSFQEIYDEYEKFSNSSKLNFPRIENIVDENKDDLDIQILKTKIALCSIDKILSTRKRGTELKA